MGQIVVVGILNFLVNGLLLLGVRRLLPGPGHPLRLLPAAAFGGLYGSICMMPGWGFLGSFGWRLVFLGISAVMAFGLRRTALRRYVLFLLLHLALTGATAGLQGRFWTAVAAGSIVGLMGAAAFLERPGTFVPVELCHGDRVVKLTALRDTGNTLTDPITGEAVLVVGADVAQKLTDLTAAQLRCPVTAMTLHPGLRLIPYKTIDRPSGMLLAMRIPRAKIGSRKGSALVAFAPEGLDEKGRYQALMGGAAS